MNIKRTLSFCFSPTGGVRRVSDILCEALGYTCERIDFTRTLQSFNFVEGDVAVISVPVYGGRIPSVARERLKVLKGSGIPAVLIAVYGNRDYDDALVELYDSVSECGFVPVAAAAMIAEHSIFHSVGTGRPDKSDAIAISSFARAVDIKLCALTDETPAVPLDIKGSRPYKSYGGVPVKPRVIGDCNLCGACAAACPVSAIPKDAPNHTDNTKCISCMRCISLCPRNARAKNLLSDRFWRMVPFIARLVNGRIIAVAEKKFASANVARRNIETFL